MENWKTRAIELFPDLPTVEELVTNPFAGALDFWNEMYLALTDCYDTHPPNDKLIAKIYDFAWWCLEQPNTNSIETDISGAAAVAFIEDLPLDRRVLRDLHRWMPVETFRGCENLLRYHLDETDYATFSTEFLRKKELKCGG